MNKWDLLSLLKGKTYVNGYISGEEISKKFNVTRAAVWKCVNELKKIGYKIESKTNRGYTLLPVFDILNEYEINSRLKNKNINYDVIYKSSTDSTNSDAKKFLGKNNTVIAAAEQTAGKGRYGRTFYSQNNGGIHFTLRINNTVQNSISIEDVTFFPLIAAVAVSRAVRDLCGIELRIKWPNDLLYKFDSDYKKLCGILTEASIEAETRSISYVIIGIGLNINNDAADFPDEIKDIATSLKIISGIKNERADILCEILYNFTQFMNMPRKELLDEYKKLLLLDIDISFVQNGKIFIGKAAGINENGNLIAELQSGEITVIQSGEINFI
ncbi:MAG: biotin--[acetyl-CoA-carboxylase] ligase [Oscillospiraceae bacterium]|nr:biotin--[acetyl-CoA-carboxylase] ligase [Oscillospiraceae bacterium]